jgi:hypothetical protein
LLLLDFAVFFDKLLESDSRRCLRGCAPTLWYDRVITDRIR